MSSSGRSPSPIYDFLMIQKKTCLFWTLCIYAVAQLKKRNVKLFFTDDSTNYKVTNQQLARFLLQILHCQPSLRRFPCLHLQHLPKQPAQTCCTVDIVSISPWSRFRPPCLGHISTKKGVASDHPVWDIYQQKNRKRVLNSLGSDWKEKRCARI